MSSTTAGIDALFVQRVHALPRLRQFIDQVQQALTPDTESFFECEGVFRDLVRDGGFVRDLISYEVSRLQENPFYSAPRGTEWQMQLAVVAQLQLSLRLVAAGPSVSPETLPGLPQHMMLGVCGPGSVSFERFRERASGLERVSREHLNPGDVGVLRAGHDVVHVPTPEEPSILLSIVCRDALPTCTTYNYTTLEPTQVSATNPGTSRLEFAAKLLAELGYTPAADAVAGLSEHPLHFVRWAAVRELTRLDPARALTLIEAAQEDPHPHVRNAARRSLARIRKETPSWL